MGYATGCALVTALELVDELDYGLRSFRVGLTENWSNKEGSLLRGARLVVYFLAELALLGCVV